MKPINEWDIYVNLAYRFNWTPEQVDALDPDFLDSLSARSEAESMNAKAKEKN